MNEEILTKAAFKLILFIHVFFILRKMSQEPVNAVGFKLLLFQLHFPESFASYAMSERLKANVVVFTKTSSFCGLGEQLEHVHLEEGSLQNSDSHESF